MHRELNSHFVHVISDLGYTLLFLTETVAGYIVVSTITFVKNEQYIMNSIHAKRIKLPSLLYFSCNESKMCVNKRTC